MYKKLSCLSVILMFNVLTSAGTFSIGVKAGLNMSTFWGTDEDPSHTNYDRVYI